MPELRPILLRKTGAIYFPVTKVACTSLRLYFCDVEDIPACESVRKRANKLRGIGRGHAYRKDLFKFAFVRNPWDRLVSCYENKVVKPRAYPDARGHKAGVFNGFLKYQRKHDCDFTTLSFPKFVEIVHSTPDSSSEQHFRSQHRFFDNTKMDFVGRFEKLGEGVEALRIRLDIDPRIKLHHYLKSDRKPYQEYYTPELVELVAERYATDIVTFDYKFEE